MLVMVCVGVKVMEGSAEAVRVGSVAVGKGPSRDFSVNAIDVRVLLAFFCAFASFGGSPKRIQIMIIKPMKRANILNACE